MRIVFGENNLNNAVKTLNTIFGDYEFTGIKDNKLEIENIEVGDIIESDYKLYFVLQINKDKSILIFMSDTDINNLEINSNILIQKINKLYRKSYTKQYSLNDFILNQGKIDFDKENLILIYEKPEKKKMSKTEVEKLIKEKLNMDVEINE